MNPIVHAELSWLAGVRLTERRDRLLVTLAGVVPDLDGLSLLGGVDAYAKWQDAAAADDWACASWSAC